MDKLIGNKLKFKIIKFNKKRGNIVLSRRILLERDAECVETDAEALAATPLRLPLLELHHIVDSPVEEGGRVGPALGLVVEPNEQGRNIDAAERQPHEVG